MLHETKAGISEDEPIMTRAYFILLCSKQRQKTYAPVITDCGYGFEICVSAEETLEACVRAPPLGSDY